MKIIDSIKEKIEERKNLKNNTLSNTDDILKNQIKYINWIQTFSKKIVTITFILYIISIAYSIWMLYMSYICGNLIGLDTFIAETNTTFRDVIGGYIVKSAIENTVKITGSYVIGLKNIKIDELRREKDLSEIDHSCDCDNFSFNDEENDAEG